MCTLRLLNCVHEKLSFTGILSNHELSKWLQLIIGIFIVIYGLKLSLLLRCKFRKGKAYDILRKLNWEDITPVKYLDSGNFSEVWLANLKLHTNVKPPVTIEVAYKIRQNFKEDFTRDCFLEEAVIVSQIQYVRRHQNIINFEGICVHGLHDLLVFEYMNGGNSQNFIINNRATIKLDNIRKISFDILEGGLFLQETKYVHRDIAARNVLISIQNRNTFLAKLADFGLAKDTSGEMYQYIQVIKPFNLRNTAPEGILDGIFDHKSDVWSFGVFMWELFKVWETGVCVVPYENIPSFLLKSYVCDEKQILFKPNQCPKHMYDNVMKLIWTYDRVRRPDFIRLKQMLSENWQQQNTHCTSVTNELWLTSEDLVSETENDHALHSHGFKVSTSNYEMNDSELTEVKVVRNDKDYIMHSSSIIQ